MQLKIAYLNIIKNKAGQRYAYYRRDDKSIAIKSPQGRPLIPGQPGFLDAYAAIHSSFGDHAPVAPAKSAERSVAALVASYLDSDTFAEKAGSTQALYRRITADIVRLIGPKSAAHLEFPHVLALREAFGGRKTPRKANLAVAVLSILMEHARAIGWRRDNPALRPKKLATGPGIPAWTEDEVEQFLASPAVGEPLKRAAALAYWTGLRVGDLVKVRRADRQGGAIAVTTGKTGAEAHIPEHPRLAAVLDAAPPSISPRLLTRPDGCEWQLSHLKHSMTAAVREIGLRPGLSFHGLRKGMTAALAEGGATDAEIEAVIPHSDPAMTRYYRRGANQKRMAVAAIGKLKGA